MKLWKTDTQLAYALQNEFANLQYGYAITSHKAQGSTYDHPYTIWEWTHPRFDERAKYVVLSRSKKYEHINIR